MKHRLNIISALLVSLLFALCVNSIGAQNGNEVLGTSVSVSSKETQDAAKSTIHIKRIDLPFSSFASPEARALFAKMLAVSQPDFHGDISAQRAYYARYNDELATQMKERYPVNIATSSMGGVKVEIITPKTGVPAKNRRRVLINLHGGGFMWGEGAGGEVEAIPISAVGKMRVISVAYRLAPESAFPAASEDVASVYRDLLKTYQAAEIGIYGCSAGGVLTAESIPWFLKHHLPLPGAIGTFCGSVSDFEGDSAYLAPLTTSQQPTSMAGHLMVSSYFKGADPNDPLVFPIASREILSRFPPTLLLAGSRDFSVSSLFATDAALSSCGVETELHVWDGMWHAFIVHPELPEAQQAYSIVARFFDRHLRSADLISEGTGHPAQRSYGDNVPGTKRH
jgi:acetyl esterase/lipase